MSPVNTWLGEGVLHGRGRGDVRRNTGEDWRAYLVGLMRAEGVIGKDDQPTDEDVLRYDKQRKNKRVSNEDWQSSSDPESRITKLKDGRTHLAYKAEHVVDLKTEMVLAAEVYRADRADTVTMIDSVMEAQVNIDAAHDRAGVATVEIEEAAADKGYHAAHTLELADSLSVRTYITEPRRKHKARWTDKPEEYRTAVINNRRRIRRDKSHKLQRLRSERAERSFAHVCDSGGARRTWLRGLQDVTKRDRIAAAAHNLGRIMRALFGSGKPRGLQGGNGLASLVHFAIQLLVWPFAAFRHTPKWLTW